MFQDLRSYITKKEDYVQTVVNDEDVEDFLKFLQRGFNISEDFLNGLRFGYKDIIEYDWLNLNMFADPYFYQHLCDFLEVDNNNYLGTDDLLLFLLNTHLPDAEIILNDLENYYDGWLGEEAPENIEDLHKEHLDYYIKRIEKLSVPELAKKEIIDFLENNFIEYLEYAEDNPIYFMNILVSSNYLYKILKNNEIKELYEKYFGGWNFYFDEQKELGYIWYSILGFEEEQTMSIVDVYNFEKSHSAFKELFNLDYVKIPQDIIDNIELESDIIGKGGIAIRNILSAKETEEEVMF